MIVTLIIIALYAAYCATDDFAEISSGLFINHRVQWIFRAVISVSFIVSWWAAMNPHWTRVLFTSIASAPLFSIVFRTSLNLIRRKPWWYLGPNIRGKGESWYDTLYWNALYTRQAIEWRPGYWAYYSTEGKGAGLLATFAEVSAFAVFCVLGYLVS